MFGVSKDKLFRGLSALSDCVCGYTHPDRRRKDPATQPHVRCDCKYGLGEDGRFMTGSEQTGCPEAMMAADLVRVMTDAEFARLCKRAGVLVYMPAPVAKREAKRRRMTAPTSDGGRRG